MEYIPALSDKLDFNDDLYVFFTFRAFGLPERHYTGIARPGGVVCYITSDTYFTLETKTRMCQLLQAKDLRLLVQCDPFRQTVDTAIFLARNREGDTDGVMEFIQARPVTNRFPMIPFGPTWQAGAVAQLPPAETDEVEEDSPAEAPVTECEHDHLRRYQVPVTVYQRALKEVFFEPSRRNVSLYNRFNDPLNHLIDEWWDRIEDSRKFDQNRRAVEAYQRTLKPGDITILGLMCEGGQGIATANNARFLGFLDGTPKAAEIRRRRKELETAWAVHPKASRTFTRLRDQGKDFVEIADALREQFDPLRELGFKKTDIYRLVTPSDVANVEEMTSDEQRQGIKNASRCCVPFRKGDPEGNRWLSAEPLFIFWSRENVKWLFENSGKRGKNMPVVRNPHLYFRECLSWQRTGRDVRLKVRFIPKCVFDSETPVVVPVGTRFSAFSPCDPE